MHLRLNLSARHRTPTIFEDGSVTGLSAAARRGDKIAERLLQDYGDLEDDDPRFRATPQVSVW